TAATAAALAAFASRRLPSLYTLITQDRGADERAGYVSRNKSVLLPVVMGLSLVLLMFFVFLVFQVGFAGLASQVPHNTILLGTVTLILVAFIASVWVAVS